MPDGLAGHRCGLLHDATDEVEGDEAHHDGLVREVRAFDREAFHAERAFQVAQFQFDVPAPDVEPGQLQGIVPDGIGQGGDKDQLRLVSRTVLVVELDEAQRERGRQTLPFLAGCGAARRARRPLPGDETVAGTEALAVRPVQRLVPGLVEAHQGMAPLPQATGQKLVGTEGPVGEQQVAFPEKRDEPGRRGAVVPAPAPGLEMLPTAMAEVEKTYDAHRRKTAAGLLAGRLGVGQLVGRGVHELHRAAVDGFQIEPVPAVVGGLDAGPERVHNAPVDGMQERQAEAAAGLAIAGSVRRGDRQPAGPAPALDEADGLLARGVGFEDLGEPGPEHRHMAEVALALGGVDGCEEITREELREEDRVAAQRAPGEERPRLANGSLQASPRGGKNGERKAGQERLFGHTL